MLEFCYELPYEDMDFTDPETHKLYRIGRGEQGVLLVRPYTNDICAHWKFRTPEIAVKSANKIFAMYLDYRDEEDFVGMDMCVVSFLKWDLPDHGDMPIIETVKSMMKKVM